MTSPAPTRRLLPLLVLALPALSATGLAQAPRQEMVERLCEEYAKRGFEIDASQLRVEVADPERMRADFDGQQGFFFAPGYFRCVGYLYDALRLLPEGGRDGFRELVVGELGSAVQAYFQFDRKAMVFLDSPLTALTGVEPVVAHELGHAWRHLQHDMGKLAAKEDRTLEQARIVQCLIEGEAELISMDLMLSRTEGSSLSDIAPGAISSADMGVADPAAVLPYDVGRDFMLHRYHAGGWPAVHAAVDDPPVSTEQMLHPEKYERDVPVVFALPEWPEELGEGVLDSSEVVGEFGIYSLLLSSGHKKSAARIASTGWDGDRLALYRVGADGWVLAWRTLWDREQDAQDFAAAIDKRIRRKPVVRGRVVDWAWGSSTRLAKDYLAHLERNPLEVEADPADAESTAAVEAGIEALGGEPHVADGFFVHPQHKLRVPVPKGWEMVEVNGAAYAMGERVEGFRDNLSIQSMSASGMDAAQLLAANREFLESAPNFQLELAERVRHRGHDALSIEYSGHANGFDLYFCTLTLLREGQQIIVTLTMRAEHREAMEDEVVRVLGGVEVLE